MGKIKCIYCDENETESPFMNNVEIVVNPRTFRKAYMCGYCFDEEFNNLAGVESSDIMSYIDRQDEYTSKFL